jgi:hypothetical protein
MLGIKKKSSNKKVDEDRFFDDRLRAMTALDIARALKDFRSRGIVLGNLSPSMIGFDHQGKARLLIDEDGFKSSGW